MKTPSGFILPVLALALFTPALHAQAPSDPQATTDTQAPLDPQAAPAAAAPATARTDAAPSVAADPTPGSDVRIVRLSQTKGDVQLDRNTDRGFEPAFPNLPIIQHARLRTADGIAEVEFEDNSSLRLTPNTIVDFPQLRLNPAGVTLSTVHVLQGAVYISLENSRANQFTVTVGNQQLTLAPGSHIELSAGTPSKLSVFEGAVDVQRSTGPITVGKKKELVFDAANTSAPTLLTKVEKTPFDDWDKSSAGYHKQYSNAAFGNSFGGSDLNYYGAFADLPGCGNVWRPYFTSAAWSPFSNGLWAWYPGAGYSWVSPYPWGWTPFHSGSWQQCGGNGWGWRPGGAFTGLGNASKIGSGVNTPTHTPRPPSPGRPTMVPVNTRPLVVSGLASSDAFVFHKDSAGLGVPRDAFGDLKSASTGVERHGAAVTSVASSPGLVTLRPGSVNSAAAGPASSSAHYTHITAVAGPSNSSNSFTNANQPTSSLNSSSPAPSVHTATPSPSPASTGSSRK